MVDWGSLPWGIILSALFTIISFVFTIVAGLFLYNVRKMSEEIQDVKSILEVVKSDVKKVYDNTNSSGNEVQSVSPVQQPTNTTETNSNTSGKSPSKADNVKLLNGIIKDAGKKSDLHVQMKTNAQGSETYIIIKPPTGSSFKPDLPNDPSMEKTYENLQQDGEELFGGLFEITSSQEKIEIIIPEIQDREQKTWLRQSIQRFNNPDTMIESEAI